MQQVTNNFNLDLHLTHMRENSYYNQQEPVNAVNGALIDQTNGACSKSIGSENASFLKTFWL